MARNLNIKRFEFASVWKSRTSRTLKSTLFFAGHRRWFVSTQLLWREAWNEKIDCRYRTALSLFYVASSQSFEFSEINANNGKSLRIVLETIQLAFGWKSWACNYRMTQPNASTKQIMTCSRLLLIDEDESYSSKQLLFRTSTFDLCACIETAIRCLEGEKRNRTNSKHCARYRIIWNIHWLYNWIASCDWIFDTVTIYSDFRPSNGNNDSANAVSIWKPILFLFIFCYVETKWNCLCKRE